MKDSVVHRSPAQRADQERRPHLGVRVLLGLVWLYQKLISPVIPAIFGPNAGCRFYPTCSHYAAEALRTQGVGRGLWLAGRRLLRCTPLSAGGLDPVPPPRCVRVKSRELE